MGLFHHQHRLALPAAAAAADVVVVGAAVSWNLESMIAVVDIGAVGCMNHHALRLASGSSAVHQYR